MQYGYDANEFIAIDETELEKAIYIHLTGKKGGFNNGTVDGNKIISISPDWNRAMGWNVGYKPTPEEHGEIQAEMGARYNGIVAMAKNKVQEYLENGQIELIGTQPLIVAPKIHTNGPVSLSALLPK